MPFILLIVSRFGWVNASYVYGLQLLPAHARRAIGTLTEWETYEKATTAVSENSDVFEDSSDYDDSLEITFEDVLEIED